MLARAAGFRSRGSRPQRPTTALTARRLSGCVQREVDDDAVLACALAARADFMVSGEDNLLVHDRFPSIPIVSVAWAVKRFAATR